MTTDEYLRYLAKKNDMIYREQLRASEFYGSRDERDQVQIGSTFAAGKFSSGNMFEKERAGRKCAVL